MFLPIQGAQTWKDGATANGFFGDLRKCQNTQNVSRLHQFILGNILLDEILLYLFPCINLFSTCQSFLLKQSMLTSLLNLTETVLDHLLKTLHSSLILRVIWSINIISLIYESIITCQMKGTPLMEVHDHNWWVITTGDTGILIRMFTESFKVKISQKDCVS